jgi:hypothetical protein
MIMETTILIAGKTDTVNVITQITYLLFLFLILAIFVERATEVFMSILKYVDLKMKWFRLWNKKAVRYRERLDRLYRLQGRGTNDKKMLYKWIFWNVVSEEPYTGGRPVVAAKNVRTRYYRLIGRGFAFVLSLVFSIWIYGYLGVDLVDILENVGDYQVPPAVDSLVWLKVLITTGILTAGSEPLHQLIKRAEKRGKKHKKQAS